MMAIAGMAAYSAQAAVPTLTGTDVGYPSMPGSFTTSTDATGGTVYTVVGGGGDIWGTADNFYYAYFKVTGDFDYVVNVKSHVGNSGDGGWSKAELMARVDDGSGFPQGGDMFLANMATRPSSDTANGAPAGVNYRGPQWRAQRDQNCSWTTPNPAYPPNATGNWLRLERVGNVLYMYTSNDGKAWSMYNPYDPQGWDTSGSWPPGTDNPDVAFFNSAWPSEIMLGLAVTAHNDGDVSTVEFSNFGPYTPTPVAITTQPPANLSIPQNNALELKVVATGDPVHYQWRKNGTPIARAVGPTYKVDLAQISDAGEYTVRVFGGGKEVISSPCVVAVTVDTQAPTVKKVTPDFSFTAVRVEFSEPVTDTALTAGNYKIDQGITVSSVARITPTTVALTTSKMGEGVSYELTINGVKDTANPANTIATDTQVPFMSVKFETGWATYERWDNANGQDYSLADFITAVNEGTIRPPDISTSVAQFGGPWGATDYYSSRVSGYFIPPSNGNYVFFLAADDAANLYLSTDDKPANKKLIAQESGWSNQYQWQTIGGGSSIEDKRSDMFFGSEWTTPNTITLTAGRRYYIEILHDEGSGGDGSDATFIKEGQTDPTQDAAGMFLKGSAIGSYLDPNGAEITFEQQPQDVATEEGRSGTFTVKATGKSNYGSTVTYQWQKAAPGSTTFTDIAGATSDTYTTPALTLADDGSKFQVICKVPTLAKTSSAATLTINTDKLGPLVVGVGAVKNPTSGFDVGVSFDEPVDQASATTVGNYTLSAGAISAVKYYKSSPGVVLTVSGLTAGNKYSVTVKNILDLKGNKMIDTSREFTVSKMSWGVVGASELNLGNGVLAVAENGFDVYSDGIAEWGTYDEAALVYEEITGDFDKKVRIEYQDSSSQWARAGLVVRDVTNFGVDRATQEGGAAGRYQKVHVNPVQTAMGTGGNNSWEGNRRLETGAATTTAGGGGVPKYPNAWCRLQRSNDVFTIYRSDDGKNWTQLGQTVTGEGGFVEPMPAKVFVGIDYSPENGNIGEDTGLRAMWMAKFRDYGDTFAPEPITPEINIARDGAAVKITFTGKLQSADALTGTFQDVTGAASPYTIPVETSIKFYRAASQ